MTGAEDIFKRIGSVGSVKDLIASIGGDSMTTRLPKKKKKSKKPVTGGASSELQEMLKTNYSNKHRPTSRSGPM